MLPTISPRFVLYPGQETDSSEDSLDLDMSISLDYEMETYADGTELDGVDFGAEDEDDDDDDMEDEDDEEEAEDELAKPAADNDVRRHLRGTRQLHGGWSMAGSTTDMEAGLIMEDIMEGTAAVMVVATAGAPVATAVSSAAAACCEESSVGLCGASIWLTNFCLN